MLKVALKGLMARKLRTALTGFAVVIGVAFVAGTFIFTDTIDASFKDLFERTQKGTDVSVQARLAVDEPFKQPPTMPADTLERVRSVPGVDEAVGSVSYDRGALLDDKGEPILSNGPPTIIVSAVPERFDPLTYVEGHKAETDDEVVIDKATADEFDFRVGERVTVVGSTPKKEYTVAGISTLGDSENLAGSRLVQMTLPEAQRVSGHDGYDDISVAAAGGTSPEQLKAAISKELGTKDFAVRTGKEQAEKSAQDLSDALGFIRIALLVFAGVALLVGSFLIFNTFAVTVAQRSKEFALLRTLGASRAQVLRSVLAETLAIGIGASILGIIGGLLLAPGLRALHVGLRAQARHHEPAVGAAHDHRRLRRRDHRDGRVRLRAGPPRDARAAGRGHARRRPADRPAPAEAPHRRRRARRDRRPRAARLQPVRRPAVGDRGRVDPRLRRRGDDVRPRADRAAARAAAEQRDREAARALAGPHRPARARERATPAAAHRRHRVGADDRPRAGRVRDDLRRGPAGDDQPGHRRPGARGRHHHARGRLLAAARRRRPDALGRQRRRRRVADPVRDRQAQERRQERPRDRRRSGDRGRGAPARVEPGLGADAGRTRRPRRRRQRDVREEPRSRGRRQPHADHPARQRDRPTRSPARTTSRSAWSAT